VRISQVRVEGYRCIKDMTIDFDELTALIGSGGVGKSAFLRALEWFFDETTLDEEDLYLAPGEDSARSEQLTVTVSFDSLDAADKAVLDRYGAEGTTTFTRTGRPGEKSKLSGTALVCPDFAPIRAETDGRKRKTAFAAFAEQRAADFDFPTPLPRKIEEIDLLLEQFERANPTRCELAEGDASHLFGWGGGPKLRDRFDYVLVGATLEATEAVAGTQGSALSRLLSDIGELDEATELEVGKLAADAELRMKELITASRAPNLERAGKSISERMQGYVPGARVELVDELGGVARPKPKVSARLREGEGHATEVDRQGHGLQRALVIAVLHALADNDAGVNAQEGASEEPRALMLAIEEPELYQHPFQARALAESLRTLTNLPSPEKPRSLQVSYSTHSPHFVRPALFENLRILRRGQDLASAQVSGDPEAVAKILIDAGLDGNPPGMMRKTLSKSLEEAVFAKAVLLCEGSTDAALLAAVAAREGGFDRLGIAVADCHGKSIIPLAYAILRQLKIPTYVLFDADAGAEQRLGAKQITDEQRVARLADIAAKNEALLGLCGDPVEPWPGRAARAGSANFADNLEVDLADIWPQFAETCAEVGAELGIGPKSDETYRQAAVLAPSPPAFLTEVVAKVRELVE
jgi:putative ATP-dependent endonuclease of OLD family